MPPRKHPAAGLRALYDQPFEQPRSPATPGRPAPTTPDLLEEDYREPYQAWKQAPTPAATGNLLRSLQPVLGRALRAYGGASGPDNRILAARAKALTLQHLPGYDSSKGKLSSYLTGHLQGLRRISAEQGEVIPLPEQVRLDRRHLWEESERLTDTLGREPDDLELADHTGLSLRRITHLRKASSPVAEGSLQAPGESGALEPFDTAVTVPGEDAGETAWRDFVYQGLTPPDRLILAHTLGLHGRPILENRELAHRLRLTPSAVSQRKARLQRLLMRRDELGVM